jgi:hypothetical protein
MACSGPNAHGRPGDNLRPCFGSPRPDSLMGMYVPNLVGNCLPVVEMSRDAQIRLYDTLLGYILCSFTLV